MLGHSRLETWVSPSPRCYLWAGLWNIEIGFRLSFFPSPSVFGLRSKVLSMWGSGLGACQCPLPGAPHGCHKRVRILFLDLKEFCSCCSVVHTVGVSMVFLFVFPRARRASCPLAQLLWRRDGRSQSDGEGEKTKRISPCSHPGLGDKSTLLVVLKPEEVCLPQPTPAQLYIVQLK